MAWFMLLLALLGTPASSDPLAEAQERFRALSSYRVTVRLSAEGSEQHVLRYFYRKPGWIRIEFIRPHPGLVLIYNPDTRRVRVWPFGLNHLPRLNLAPDNPLVRGPHGIRVDQSDVGVLLESLRERQARGSLASLGRGRSPHGRSPASRSATEREGTRPAPTTIGYGWRRTAGSHCGSSASEPAGVCSRASTWPTWRSTRPFPSGSSPPEPSHGYGQPLPPDHPLAARRAARRGLGRHRRTRGLARLVAGRRAGRHPGAGARGSGLGARQRFTWKGALPYRLSFVTCVTRFEPRRLLEGRVEGELEGIGRWRFDADAGRTWVRFDWQVHTTPPWMNLLAPLARPLFRWNHGVLMHSGGIGLARRLGTHLAFQATWSS
ncbi:hypothetical protein ACE0DR_08610 [Azotobacter sp. CWF10]